MCPYKFIYRIQRKILKKHVPKMFLFLLIMNGISYTYTPNLYFQKKNIIKKQCFFYAVKIHRIFAEQVTIVKCQKVA